MTESELTESELTESTKSTELTIHQRKIFKNNSEFKIISDLSHYPLVIHKDVAEFDRDIFLLRDLSRELELDMLISVNTTHGGYVPCGCVDYFSRIEVISEKDSLGNILRSPLSSKFNIVGDIRDIEDSVIYFHKSSNPSSSNPSNFSEKEFNAQILISPEKFTNEITNEIINENYFCYSYPPDKFIYVKKSSHRLFLQKFHFYIDENNFRYDNLINLLIMVKDAGDGFRDILRQNLPFVDRWTFLDTGSTDNTVQIIKEEMKGKKGELYIEPFINFRDSRNRLLELAGDCCAFNIFLDDTYVLKGSVREWLTLFRGDDVADSFSVQILETDLKYNSNRITKPSRKLRYVNLIHEIIQPNKNISLPKEYFYILDVNSKYMEKRTKNRKKSDLDLLFLELKEKPDDPRTIYYIAETYLCLEDWENAVVYYKKRSEMTSGYNEERFDSFYKYAVLNHIHLKKDWDICLPLYLKAFHADPARGLEPLFMIGSEYISSEPILAFMFLKQAYEIGAPSDKIYGMNLKVDMYYRHLPQRLLPLCYKFRDYVLGERIAKELSEYSYTGEVQAEMWHSSFRLLNAYTHCLGNSYTYPLDTTRKYIIFVAPGGWEEWDGDSLRDKGLGGSETCVVSFAEWICNKTPHKVIVFNKCKERKDIRGVIYIPLVEYYEFIGKYSQNVDRIFIHRYSEYLAVSAETKVPIYLIWHDLPREGEVVVETEYLKGIICLTDWHVRYCKTVLPYREDLYKTLSYGMECEYFRPSQFQFVERIREKNEITFIYSSFPSRGLYWLLKMFPYIVERFPRAKLHVFCRFDLDYLYKNYGTEMNEIKDMLEKQKETVINHGWVRKEVLYDWWNKADIFFYPCTFLETCCLTAYEAAASKTLIVCNDYGALSETVTPERGIVIPGRAEEEGWQILALNRIINILSGVEDPQKYIDRNYTWVREKRYDVVVDRFVRDFF